MDGTLFAFSSHMGRDRRHVVAVSGDAQRTRFLDALLDDDTFYGSVTLETIAGAYTRIRRERPELVIVYLAIDDAATCGLLSMLALDPETSGIPVITWAERFDGGGFEWPAADAMKDSPARTTAVRSN